MYKLEIRQQLKQFWETREFIQGDGERTGALQTALQQTSTEKQQFDAVIVIDRND